MPVHIHIRRHRPADSRRGVPGPFCLLQDTAHVGIEVLPAAVPGCFLLTREEGLIVDDVVAVRVHPGHHGGVNGIGEGRIDGNDVADHCRVLQNAAKGGQRPHKRQVLRHHGVN